MGKIFEDRNKIIDFMKSEAWIVYETLGDGKIHLITDINYQMNKKVNIFCVKREENRQDFDTVIPYLSMGSIAWLKNALMTANSDGHEWISRLEKR